MPFDGRILSGVSVLAAVVDGGSFVKAARLFGHRLHARIDAADPTRRATRESCGRLRLRGPNSLKRGRQTRRDALG